MGDFLALLLAEGVARRKQARLQHSTRNAHLPFLKTVDEFDFTLQDAANGLFHVVNDRHLRRRPMIFTTNKPLNEWGKVLHDEDMAAAILDQVLERGQLEDRIRVPAVRHASKPTRRSKFRKRSSERIESNTGSTARYDIHTA